MGPVRCAAKSDAEILNRRAMIAAAAASVVAIATPVFAETDGTRQAVKAGFGLQDDVKKGSKEAKKKFANICVSQPTASVCHG